MAEFERGDIVVYIERPGKSVPLRVGSLGILLEVSERHVERAEWISTRDPSLANNCYGLIFDVLEKVGHLDGI